jgi:hypothetical protein
MTAAHIEILSWLVLAWHCDQPPSAAPVLRRLDHALSLTQEDGIFAKEVIADAQPSEVGVRIRWVSGS